MLVFIDFNGTVGEIGTAGIGTCGDAPPLDAGGALLSNFMAPWALCATATFATCQCGPSATWTSPIGRSSRKDMVLWSAELQLGFSAAWVDQRIDMLQKKDVHRPSILQGRFVWPQTVVVVSRRPAYSQRSDLVDLIRFQFFR